MHDMKLQDMKKQDMKLQDMHRQSRKLAQKRQTSESKQTEQPFMPILAPIRGLWKITAHWA